MNSLTSSLKFVSNSTQDINTGTMNGYFLNLKFCSSVKKSSYSGSTQKVKNYSILILYF